MVVPAEVLGNISRMFHEPYTLSIISLHIISLFDIPLALRHFYTLLALNDPIDAFTRILPFMFSASCKTPFSFAPKNDILLRKFPYLISTVPYHSLSLPVVSDILYIPFPFFSCSITVSCFFLHLEPDYFRTLFHSLRFPYSEIIFISSPPYTRVELEYPRKLGIVFHGTNHVEHEPEPKKEYSTADRIRKRM
jgi:hypothetical protein